MNGRTSPCKTVEQILNTARLLQQAQTAFLGEFGLSEVRFRVLGVLDAAGDEGLPQARLAETLQQAESSVCTLAERMCQDDLVCRRMSSTDRRKRILLLTERGRRLWQTAQSHHDQESSATLSGLTDGQRESLSHLLEVLLKNLQDGSNKQAARVKERPRTSIPEPHFVSIGAAVAVSQASQDTLD